MLNEAKLACQAMDIHYEPELCRMIRAALTEMRTRGVEFEGDFTYETDTQATHGLPLVSSWECTVEDDWIKTAVMTYVKANAPWTESAEREKLTNAFEGMLDRIMHTTGYHKGWETESDG